MSLVQDLTTYLGPASAPALIAGATYGAFAFAGTIASPQATVTLQNRLHSVEFGAARHFPSVLPSLFDRAFGRHHFSVKCLYRSFVFSAGCIIFFLTLSLLLFFEWIYAEWNFYEGYPERSFWIAWAFFSAILDYFNLFKTRLIVNALSRRSLTLSWMILVILADFGAWYLLFFGLYGIGGNIIVSYMFVPVDFIELMMRPPDLHATWFVVGDIASPFNLKSIESTFFYSGMVPSIWIWLYVASFLATRVILHSERPVNWLRWALDIDRQPFQSLGVVASGIVFVLSVIVVVLIPLS